MKKKNLSSNNLVLPKVVSFQFFLEDIQTLLFWFHYPNCNTKPTPLT